MRTTDYNGKDGKSLDSIKERDDEKYNAEDLGRIAKIDLNRLKDQSEFPNLLIFPREWSTYHDSVGSSAIFSLSEKNMLKTRNIMGFVGLNYTNLTIASRFAADDLNNYFLQYMVLEVMNINVFDLPHSAGKNSIWDLLLLLFPKYLKKALSQGLYKEYKHNEYNDANVRGVIDVKRHLRLNIPFSGKIAYSTREYSYDNPVTQIIRHTIEYLKNHELGRDLLTSDTETFMNVNQIMLATSTYNRNDRLKIININRVKTVVHPYYREYRDLQNLCIRILCNEKMSYNNEREKIHGILFDGPWLWEEYLAKILKKRNFSHQNRYDLFKGSDERIFPDFTREDDKEPIIICDAKYKQLDVRLGSKDKTINDKRKPRNFSDYYQLISYMYRLNSKKGFLLFPYPEKKWKEPEIKKIIPERELTGFEIVLFGLKIPGYREKMSFKEFRKAMKESENKLLEAIDSCQ